MLLLTVFFPILVDYFLMSYKMFFNPKLRHVLREAEKGKQGQGEFVLCVSVFSERLRVSHVAVRLDRESRVMKFVSV